MREREKRILRRWEEIEIHKKLAQKTPHGLKYVVHEAPVPIYDITDEIIAARIMRDVYLRYKSMTGFNVICSPEWNVFDHRVEREVLGESGETIRERDGKINIRRFRKACRERAFELIEETTARFKRLGIISDWDVRPSVESKFASRIAEAIGRLYDEGHLSDEVKSLHWCVACQEPVDPKRSSLGTRKSISAYMRLPLLKGLEGFGRRVYLIAFSGEMWIFLGSSAVAARNGRYVAMLCEDGVYVDSISSPWLGELQPKAIKEVTPDELREVTCDHPITGKEMPVVFTDSEEEREEYGFFVISPAHRPRDYFIALEHCLEITSIVDDEGKLNELSGDLCEARFDSVEELIRDELKGRGYLIAEKRRNVPVLLCPCCGEQTIFKPSVQWFFDSYPISLRRLWGVPMFVIYCSRCEGAVLSEEIGRHIRDSLNRRGVDSWFRLDPGEILPEEISCWRCSCREFHKAEGTVTPIFAFAVNQAHMLSKRKDRVNVIDLIIEPSHTIERWLPMLKKLMELLYDDALISPIILPINPPKPERSIPDEFKSGDVGRLSFFIGPSEAREIIESLYGLFWNILEVTKEADEEFDFTGVDPEARSLLIALDILAGEVMSMYESLRIREAIGRLSHFTFDRLGPYLEAAQKEGNSAPLLREISVDLLKLWAPITPFTAEEIWLKINPEDEEGSIFMEMMPLGWMG